MTEEKNRNQSRIKTGLKKLIRRVGEIDWDEVLGRIVYNAPVVGFLYSVENNDLDGEPAKFWRNSVSTFAVVLLGAYSLASYQVGEWNFTHWQEANQNYQKMFKPYGLLDTNKDGILTNAEKAIFYDDLGMEVNFSRPSNKNLETFLKDHKKL